MWEKLWHREHQKKKKKKKKTRSFPEKESYRWVEALSEVEKLLSENQETLPTSPKVIHVFDREGDIAEVFEQVTQTDNTGIVVRAAHNRAISETDSYLWEEVTSQPIQFMMELKLPKTKKRSERQASLAIRYTPLKLRSPQRLKNQEYFEVYAVYAHLY